MPLVLACVLLLAGLTAALTAWSAAPARHGSAPAPGPRDRGGRATAAHPAQLTVVGLGDSVTAGTACDCADYVARYAAQVPASAGGPARAVNLGVGGLTSTELLADLKGQGPMPLQVASGRRGARDHRGQRPRAAAGHLRGLRLPGCVLLARRPGRARNLTGIVAQVKALRGGHPTRILVTDYWNVFEDGDVASAGHGPSYLAWSDDLSRRLNAAALLGGGGRGRDVRRPLRPVQGRRGRNPTALLAGDGDHPNAAGHGVIAAALLRASRF